MNREAEDRLLRLKTDDDNEEAAESINEAIAPPSIPAPVTR
jgi:hypothetical protein